MNPTPSSDVLGQAHRRVDRTRRLGGDAGCAQRCRLSRSRSNSAHSMGSTISSFSATGSSLDLMSCISRMLSEFAGLRPRHWSMRFATSLAMSLPSDAGSSIFPTESMTTALHVATTAARCAPTPCHRSASSTEGRASGFHTFSASASRSRTTSVAHNWSLGGTPRATRALAKILGSLT